MTGDGRWSVMTYIAGDGYAFSYVIISFIPLLTCLHVDLYMLVYALVRVHSSYLFLLLGNI